MKIKKHNFKFLLIFLIGVLFVGGVYAASSIASSLVIYDGDYSSSSINNVQSAIDDLASKVDVPEGCPSNHHCELNSQVSLGDYVSYTPSIASFTTDTAKTGYSSSQTIKPSELKLWRVLAINDDGTIDIISEYLPSNNVTFSGEIGFKNYIGYLNVLASKYETSGITLDSRHFGYSWQTEYITSSSLMDQGMPIYCGTEEYCFSDERYGGGDSSYFYDYEQLIVSLGTRNAYMVGTSSSANYFIASRSFNDSYLEYEEEDEETGDINTYEDTWYTYSLRFISNSQLTQSWIYEVVEYGNDDESSDSETDISGYIRPIVTLKADINFISGNGSSGSPWKVN